MVWIESWETFYAEAEKLFLEHPQHTRYVTKYRHVDGKLELKVTNDRVCFKFLTDQQQDLKRIDKLNNLLLTHMVGIDPYAESLEEPSQGRPASGGDAKLGSADDSAVPASSAAGKKKKAKK